jgi:hypothetical protein
MSRVFKFRIELERSNPKIWREILVPSDITFYRLHHIIQIVMGWENYHLYEFAMDSYRIGQQFEDDGFNGSHGIIDAERITIGDVLNANGQKMGYLYDFGDYWQHSLTLEMIIEDLGLPFPVCCSGELSCPPEDVGGLPGFYDFLKIMSKPRHPEHTELKKWVRSKLVAIDGKYDPQKFPIEKVNQILLRLDVYIKEWEDEGDQD